jgi:predicted nucleic acid-binding protein
MGNEAPGVGRSPVCGALTNDPTLSLRDEGERCAILLAQSEPEVLLLIDEAAGRLEASRRGIPNTGTVGALRAAAIARLVDLPSALARLVATNFRISRPLLNGLIAEDADRARAWKKQPD